MAQTGGNKKSSSKLQKAHYQQYKLEDRAKRNKIKKLERHCKQHPNDETGKVNLARIKKEGYNPRSKPLVPGSNKPSVITYQFNRSPGDIHLPQTAGEQLSKLLGIPLRRGTPKKKAKIIRKRKKNVKKS